MEHLAGEVEDAGVEKGHKVSSSAEVQPSAMCATLFTSMLKAMHCAAGSPEQPRCGFSAKVVRSLQDIHQPFGTFDILSDEAVRQGLKEFSQWPTYPQMYVGGELMGGCDIILEMAQAGELQSSIKEMLPHS